VWVPNSDGSNAVQLTSFLASDTPPWSPDGRWLARDTHAPDGRWDIYAMKSGETQESLRRWLQGRKAAG